MMRAYSQVESLKLVEQFQNIGLKLDKFTFAVVLKVSGHCLMIRTGGSLHSMAVKSGFGSDLHVNNTILRMYAGFGVIRFARQVFDDMLERDIVSWSSMMVAYVHCNLPSDDLLLFQCVKLANEKPNSVTLVSLRGACTRILNIRLGKCIHSHIVTSGIELHVELETALLVMYAKCGHIQQAFCIFNSMDDKNLQTYRQFRSPGMKALLHSKDKRTLSRWRKINCFFLGNTTRLRYKFRGAVALTIGRGSH